MNEIEKYFTYGDLEKWPKDDDFGVNEDGDDVISPFPCLVIWDDVSKYIPESLGGDLK